MTDGQPQETSAPPDTSPPDPAAGATAATASTQAAAPQAKKPWLLRRFWNAVKRKADISWRFTKELFNDHTFWVKALAVKGGASAIIVTGLVYASLAVNMPILLTIGTIALGTGVVAAGLYGIAAGGAQAWEGLKDVYDRTMGRAPKEHVYKQRKDLLQRIAETKFAKDIAAHKWAKKIANSYAWKTTMKLTRRGEDSVLGGIAVGGAAISLAVGIVALPVLATSAIISGAAILTVSTLVSSMTGFYFSITGIKEERRMKREHAEQEKKKKAFWKKPGSLFHWNVGMGQPVPMKSDEPFAPIGHPFVPQIEVTPKVTEIKPLKVEFDPASGAVVAVQETVSKPAPPAPPKPKAPDSAAPAQ